MDHNANYFLEHPIWAFVSVKFENWLSLYDFSTIRRLYKSSHLSSISFADILSQESDEDAITGLNYTRFGGKRNNG